MPRGDGAGAVSDPPPPPLEALFLIKFDLKVGYTLSWRRTTSPSIPLEGHVEYKSLPSGLHNVPRDLVYFIHEDTYAGVSAFRNVQATAGERGARFLAVGALVKLGDGRLGRAWEHADGLAEVADDVVQAKDKESEERVLEEYWERFGRRDGEEQAEGSGAGALTKTGRGRALSSLTLAAGRTQKLSSSHPAYSLLGYLDVFGPLVFVLQRLALLRKRILVVAPPPVRQAGEFVYDLSILSSLPSSLEYPVSSSASTRLRPLFNVGIHDIPYLTRLSQPSTSADSQEDTESGWIATTTDEILAMKPQLYDILVELPHPDRYQQRPSTAGSAASKSHSLRGRRPRNKSVGANRWPIIKTSGTGEIIRATQRDLRRYRSLRRILAPITKLKSTPPTQPETSSQDAEDDEDEETHLLYSSITNLRDIDAGEEELAHRAAEAHVTEKPSWGEVAYASFMWWAAAGEREEGVQREEEADGGLVGGLVDAVEGYVRRRGYRDEDGDGDEGEAEEEEGGSAEVQVALIAYFHRLTSSLFDTVSSVLDAQTAELSRPVRLPASTSDSETPPPEEDADGEEEQPLVTFETEDLRECGLDVWSERDRAFVREFADLWFARDVQVRGMGVECCGMRIY